MKFEVISDREKWDSYLAKFSVLNKDIYYTYEYNYLYEANGDGIAKAAIYIGNNGAVILYPFLLKEIKGYNLDSTYYDIESAYGYGGPIAENCWDYDLETFEDEFHKWCLENRIVAEFIRFHPLLKNQEKFNKNIIKERNRTTVYVEIEKDLEVLWESAFSSTNRNMIRKAQKAGIKIKASNNISNFIKIYNLTMDRLNAKDFYHFRESYYDALLKMDDNMFILEAEMGGEIVASAIFLYYGNYLHYHLSGSRKEFLKFAPNNLLLYNAIDIGHKKGLKKFHLGGGRISSEDDSLLKFKENFSKQKGEFYIGKRVHDSEIYDYLINEWKIRNNKEPQFLLQYKE